MHRRLPLRKCLDGLVALALACTALAQAGTPGILNAGDGQSWVPIATFSDELGHSHTRLEHRYQGLRILGSESILHPDTVLDRHGLPPPAPGDLEAEDSGRIAGLLRRLDLEPRIDTERAQQIVAQDLGDAAGFLSCEKVLQPRYLRTTPGDRKRDELNAAELGYRLVGFRLAWLLRVEKGSDPAAQELWDYLVDAVRGRILEGAPLAETDTPAKGTGATLFNGEVALDTTGTGIGFKLLDSTRGRGGRFGGNAVTDLDHKGGLSPGSLFFHDYTEGNRWGDGRPEGPDASSRFANGGTVAAEAAYGLQVTWDYFKRFHKRSGADGKGGSMVVRVHHRDEAHLKVPNADFDRNFGWITIHDVDPPWLAGAGLRTMAHEFTHGVTQASARLNYRGESGGLNEATSDIFGAMVQTWHKAGCGSSIGDQTSWTVDANWLDESGTPRARTMRSFINPAVDGRSPTTWSPGLADLDPHYASGPMNRAFYYLSAGAPDDAGNAAYSPLLPHGMQGIGNDRAARIWYRTLTTRLKPDSTYYQARLGALQAAVELYGAGSAENLAVAKAFAAINVGDASSPSPDPSLPAVHVSARALGRQLTLTVRTPDRNHLGSVNYLVDEVPVASSSKEPFKVVLDAGRILANGPHELSAIVEDRYGNQRKVVDSRFTLQSRHQQILVDPGFEKGPAEAWEGTSDDDDGNPVLDPRHGNSAISFFSDTRTVAQTVTLPADARYAQLEAWVRTEPDPRGLPGEALTIQVTEPLTDGADAPVLATLARIPAAPGSAGYLPWRFDLRAFAGRRVRIAFHGAIAPHSSSLIVLDDVTLVCGPSAPPGIQILPERLRVDPEALSDPLRAAVTGLRDQRVTLSVAQAKGGSVDGQGRYRAPAAPGWYQVIATSMAEPEIQGEAAVEVRPWIQVEPRKLWLEPGATGTLALTLGPGAQPAVALDPPDRAGTARLEPGRIIYQAPADSGRYHLVLADSSRPAQPRLEVEINVERAVPIRITPEAVTLAAGATGTFQASYPGGQTGPVDWTVDEWPLGGELRGDSRTEVGTPCLYRAPATPGVYHVRVTSPEIGYRSAAATVTVVDGVVVAPARAVLGPGERVRFSASAPPGSSVWWTVQEGDPGGQVDADGQYTAPATPGTYHVQGAAGFLSPGVAEVVVRAQP